MKKILFAAVAVMAMAACSNEDVISRPARPMIGFDNAFVENSTRANNDLTKSNLNDFSVYGSVAKNGSEGQIFKNQLVKKSGEQFLYTPPQYWVDNATYCFAAFAPYTDAKWSYSTTYAENGTITFDNEAAQANQDFLYAYQTRTTGAAITEAPAPVSFTFNHMLSRVKFEFTNGFAAANNITFRVREATITNLHKSGTLAVTNGAVAEAWSVADNTKAENVFAKKFGDVNIFEGTAPEDNIIAAGAKASSEHFYLIPANASYNVTFTVALYQAGVLVDTYNRTATLSYNMQPGYSYDIKATLNPSNTSDEGQIFPIEFQVSGVNDWANYTDVTGTVNQPTTGGNQGTENN